MSAVPGAEDVALPRVQSGANPQHLIVTLLGDYWMRCTEPLPSAALVALAAEFDVTATSARAALSRLARRGLLDLSKRGRLTFYGLTPRAEQVLHEGLDRIMSFGRATAPWDGSWVVLAFSVPEDRRDVRRRLRTALRWYGFAPLYDGVWVSPRADPAAAAGLVKEVGVATATIATAHIVDAVHGGDPLDAWDLDALRAAYREFIDRHGRLLTRVRRGEVGSPEALVARTQVMDDWRRFPNFDPELPEEALPGGWPLRDAVQVFTDLYDALGPLAEARVKEIVAAFDADIARRAAHHTTAESLSSAPVTT